MFEISSQFDQVTEISRIYDRSSLPERGPFNLGRWSWAVNFASFLVCLFSAVVIRLPSTYHFHPEFSVFICVLFILPTSYPVNALNMNYAIVAIGGVIVLVGLCWLFWGRYRFTGPVKTLTQVAEQTSSKYE